MLGVVQAIWVMCIVVAILFLVTRCAPAEANDQTITHKVRGEVTAEVQGINQDLIDLALIHMNRDEAVIIIDGTAISRKRRCEDSNELYAALRQSMDEAIQENPELKDVYAPAYQTIEEAWCDD